MTRALATTVAGALVCVAALTGCTGDFAETPSAQPAAPAYAAALTRAANDARRAEGLPALERSRCLDRMALPRARALVGRPLEHRPMTDVAERCAPGSRVAENLVESDATPAEVVDAWLGSAGHRNNLVDPGLRSVGTGCAPSEQGLVCAQLYLGEQP